MTTETAQPKTKKSRVGLILGLLFGISFLAFAAQQVLLNTPAHQAEVMDASFPGKIYKTSGGIRVKTRLYQHQGQHRIDLGPLRFTCPQGPGGKFITTFVSLLPRGSHYFDDPRMSFRCSKNTAKGKIFGLDFTIVDAILTIAGRSFPIQSSEPKLILVDPVGGINEVRDIAVKAEGS